MSKKTLLIVAGVLLTALVLVSCAGPEGPQGPPGPAGPAGPAGPSGPVGEAAGAGAEYVGSAACGECHTETYETFLMSGHPYKLSPVVDGKAPEYPFTTVEELPEGYTWDEISYVIGGYNWKARFVNKEGYIITNPPGAVDAEYLNQWNFANPIVGKDAGWAKYHSGEENVPYDCGTCHTTGYDPTGSFEGMPGIVGSWAEPGIQCERCHGPGSLHAANPRGVALNIERSSALCGECHLRGGSEEVNAKGGFIEHHEQYEELFQSKHITLDCVVCHDPHVGVVQLRQAGEQTTRTQCENCHWKEAQNRKSMQSVACIDCHMPRVTKSAWGDAEKFTGDIRTHLMAINPNQMGQFSEDGATALSELGLDFACKSCHNGGFALDDAVLQEEAIGFHTAP
jgi:hypothetical protein